jgi:hypothetical protein
VVVACVGVSLIGLWAVIMTMIMVMVCVLAMVMLVCGRA